ncbi:MAG: helix-turn-helix domain-containing protein [Bacteroidales bacterium]|nr:helix-turn-helix domain-containing protein [Bacteroidales bacterium]
MIRKKGLKKIRNEILKNWDLSEGKLLTLLDKQFDKLPGSYYEKSIVLRFFLRYIEFNKHYFEKSDGLVITDEDGELISTDKTPSYDDKFRQVWEWLIEKNIYTWKKFVLALLIAGLEIKDWIDQEYEINFMQQNIKEIEDQLENESPSDDNSFYEINQEFKSGNYPDVFTTDPDKISQVEAMIAFRRYLIDVISDKQTSQEKDQLSIQGEIKGENDSMGNLTVTIPLKQIKQSLKEALKKESKETQFPSQDEGINLYTRKETADMLGVSLQTLNEWNKKGIIQKHRIGDKPVRYKKEDIEKAIKKIEVYPFKSKQ